MKKEVRKCAVCGKKFTPKTANALVCSDKCYKARKAELDKKRKSAKKVEKVEKKAEKPAVKKVAKKPLKAKAVEKITLPKKEPAKSAKKTSGAPKLPKGCNTFVSIKAGDEFKVVTLALYVAFQALGRLIKNGAFKPCK